MKYIVAINASPRINWNTAQLVDSAAKGAKDAGAAVEKAEQCFSYKKRPTDINP